MRPGTVLINTSRGAIVDERAVVAALESGRLGAYGCDVLEGETDGAIGRHPLVEYARTHTNVMITPHIGGVSPDALRRTAAFMARKVLPHLGIRA
jgi:D-3-phosphoglycerate dehydrogenase